MLNIEFFWFLSIVQVLTVRAIAEFVGGEHKYTSDISGLKIGNNHSLLKGTVIFNKIFGK